MYNTYIIHVQESRQVQYTGVHLHVQEFLQERPQKIGFSKNKLKEHVQLKAKEPVQV
jgi:hypothetical protein